MAMLGKPDLIARMVYASIEWQSFQPTVQSRIRKIENGKSDECSFERVVTVVTMKVPQWSWK